jgi:hypothetical protein
LKEAVDELFDCFDQVDMQLHGEEGKSYEEVDSKITSALGILTKKVESQEE